MTLVKGPKVKDINKVIPKDYHISGVEIQKGLRSDDSEYFYVSIKITHNEYLTNSELFEPIDLPYISIDAPKEERVKKTENDITDLKVSVAKIETQLDDRFDRLEEILMDLE